MTNEIISYIEMCQKEGVSLQKGMNFQIGKDYSVILMSVRPNSPYRVTERPLGSKQSKPRDYFAMLWLTKTNRALPYSLLRCDAKRAAMETIYSTRLLHPQTGFAVTPPHHRCTIVLFPARHCDGAQRLKQSKP
ncbi:MAG: hypothetical protein ABFD29_10045 [Anaerolineaceae bacterium]